MAIVFALMTAIAYGLDNFLIRKGLIHTPYPIVAAFITLTINFSFFVILSLIFIPFEFLKLNLIYLFIIAGILAPGFARLLSYKGLEILGMSITTPIINAESLFSVTMALFFLNEPINFSIVTGILGVMGGLVLLGYEIGQKNERDISKRFRYRYLFYPITASLFYGVSVFFRKLGLNTLSSPILGATLTSGTSWCIITIVLATSGNMKRLVQVKKRSFIYFVLGGCATCIAWLSFFHALNIGRVVIVTPIATSYSLFTLFLSYLLLRDMERMSLKIIFSTILIVGGIVLLSFVK
jgi:transporter family protein